MVERMRYLEQREEEMQPKIVHCYCGDDRVLISFRVACIDRIYRLTSFSRADYSTAFAAIRLFDRCMSVMRPPIVRTNMSLLAVACFDICFKSMEGDVCTMSTERYYIEGFWSRHNDHLVPIERFAEKLLSVEVTILQAVSGQPVAPTANEYLIEGCPTWSRMDSRQGRRAALCIAAYMYTLHSTEFTSEQIAAAAAAMVLGSSTPPSDSMAHLCRSIDPDGCLAINETMAQTIDVLFTMGKNCALYYVFHDMYKEWYIKTCQ